MYRNQCRHVLMFIFLSSESHIEILDTLECDFGQEIVDTTRLNNKILTANKFRIKVICIIPYKLHVDTFNE